MESAAPISVPRRVKAICFNILDLIDLSTYRGGPGNQTSSIPPLFGPFIGTMLAPFFALGRFLGAFCTSCCVCARSWSVFVPLKALRARSGAHRARFSRGFGRFWRAKTSIFQGFRVQTKQHCANALTLTKHWQEQQKSRFSIYRELCAQAKKQ